MNEKNAAPISAAIVPVTPFQQNCTLIWNTKTLAGAVVDPGGDVDVIEQAIAKSGMKPAMILITHGHIDHVGGAEELKKSLDVPIVGPAIEDRELCEGIEKQAEMFGIPGQARNVYPDRWLQEGEALEFAGYSFDVYHCPGHAPGHVVFVNQPLRFALVGDVLFRGSIGRTDLPGGDHDALIDSIKSKLLPLGDDIQFLCGHGPGSTFGEERRSNPFLQ